MGVSEAPRRGLRPSRPPPEPASENQHRRDLRRLEGEALSLLAKARDDDRADLYRAHERGQPRDPAANLVRVPSEGPNGQKQPSITPITTTNAFGLARASRKR